MVRASSRTQLQRTRGQLGGRLVGAVLGVQQAFVVLPGKLGVDRQPDLRVQLRRAAPRQPDRELHLVVAARHGHDIGRVLLHRTVNTCSSSAASCTSPSSPRVFTLPRTRFRSPTPCASVSHLARAAVHLLQLGRRPA